MRTRTVTAAGLALALVAAGACSADDDDPVDPAPSAGTTEVADAGGLDEAALDELVERFVRAADVPGATMAVRHGEERWAGVAGDADPEEGTPIEPDAVLPIASITKTFVAALVLRQIDAGELALDDPLATWVPDWPRGDVITIRDLLAHRTGIADYIDTPELRDLLLADLERAWTPRETVELARGIPPHFDVGTDFRYSNTNYLLLGIILEAVTGSTLHDLIETELTEPAGLDDTMLFDGSTPFDDRVPRLLFDLNEDGNLVDVRDLPLRAAFTTKWAEGGMVSTADDLVDWAVALWGSDEVIADAELRDGMADVDDVGYGWGTGAACPCRGAPMDRVEFSGLGHQGDFYGSRSIVLYWPDDDVAVALLTNQSPVNGLLLDRVAMEARTIVAGTDDERL